MVRLILPPMRFLKPINNPGPVAPRPAALRAPAPETYLAEGTKDPCLGKWIVDLIYQQGTRQNPDHPFFVVYLDEDFGIQWDYAAPLDATTDDARAGYFSPEFSSILNDIVRLETLSLGLRRKRKVTRLWRTTEPPRPTGDFHDFGELKAQQPTLRATRRLAAEALARTYGAPVDGVPPEDDPRTKAAKGAVVMAQEYLNARSSDLGRAYLLMGGFFTSLACLFIVLIFTALYAIGDGGATDRRNLKLAAAGNGKEMPISLLVHPDGSPEIFGVGLTDEERAALKDVTTVVSDKMVAIPGSQERQKIAGKLKEISDGLGDGEKTLQDDLGKLAKSLDGMSNFRQREELAKEAERIAAVINVAGRKESMLGLAKDIRAIPLASGQEALAAEMKRLEGETAQVVDEKLATPSWMRTVSHWVDRNTWEVLRYAMAGAFGAMLSMLITASKRTYDAGAGRRVNMLEGFMRIVVGILAAAFITVAVKANLVVGFVSDTSGVSTLAASRMMWLHYALGFVAGFSEQLVPSFIKVVEAKTQSSSEQAPPKPAGTT